MKRILLCFLLMISLLTACGQKVETPFDLESFQMGTIITQKVYGKEAEKATKEIQEKIGQLESAMTINAPGGEVSQLNSAAGNGDWIKLSHDTLYVLETAKSFSEKANGAFDVTVGPLVKAWGIFTDTPKVLTSKEALDLVQYVNFQDIEIDKNNNAARLKRHSQLIDLGGIAKGYAGDEAIKIYKSHGIKSAYINLGGNVVVLGNKPDGTPWKIGIQNPRLENGSYIGIVKVYDKSVVTSGDYERYFEKDNIRYHHIIDPKTGFPSNSDLMSTTIICNKSIDADALSTSTFVLGLEKGLKLIESIPNTEAIFITKDKKIYTTKGLKNIFSMEDESKEYEYVEKR